MRVVFAQPALELFQSEVHRCIDDAEGRFGAELGDCEARHAVTFALQSFLEMPDLHDALPAVIWVPREEGELVLFELEYTGIQSRSPGRQ